MLKQLDCKRIAQLAERPNVKAHAVENFLFSSAGLTYQEAVANCELDARLYGWNRETSAAIREGLAESFGSQ